ncbi:hypothetical protein [Pannonibacter phragmitetus]|uniref:hypothetical protein n=1 Tax=Pannonibacter phragmitetus TaxID=121719 RepID=UPI000F01414D|nr:hypothetical protein [Pannonibacter phragmitetus]
MSDELFKQIRTAAKGSGWSVKRDVLVKRAGDHVLAVHPRRGRQDILEFRAKPIAWDHLLWSILQIEANMKQPTSFHFTGAFICDTPALLQEAVKPQAPPLELAQQMLQLAERELQMAEAWQRYDLLQAIDNEQPKQPYRYHITRVVERIWSGDRQGAHEICAAAQAGALDVRHAFSAPDKLTPADVEGRRPSLSFFQLAQLWLSRN